MKPKVLIGYLICGALLSACATDDPVNAIQQDVKIFENANILTLNPDMPSATTMTIVGHKVVAVGDSGTLTEQGAAYPNAIHIDVKGATILPGFIDSHVHVRELGMDKIKANLVGVQTNDEIVVRLKKFYPDPTPGDWLIGQGWDEGVFASIGYPDRAALDAAFPDNP
ncbi:MAG: amidohydrolase family protein, partial [Hyphomonadaceae bacterium]|nr:amidohydrolase family protein [Hyphomonadaceae bacterium]